MDQLADRLGQLIEKGLNSESRVHLLTDQQRAAQSQVDNLVAFIASVQQSNAVSDVLEKAEATSSGAWDGIIMLSRPGWASRRSKPGGHM